MSHNVGMLDRVFRIVLGIAMLIFALGYFYPGTGWNWVGWLGVIPIVTAVAGSCPLYSLLGINTCEVSKK